MSYKKPKRMFEDAGLVDPRSAYHVDLEKVVNTKNQDLKTMVDRGRYFSISAPRQSGKTTFLESFCLELEKNSTYVPIILSFQRYKSLDKQTFYQQIQKDLYNQLTNRLTSVDCPSLDAAVS
jgi:Ni2+-binding GTPase involved in maturation of urease and hydrogenase